jgi:hypothetical protein
MFKDLQEVRLQLETAVAQADEPLVFKLTKKYLRLYKLCWPA